MTESCDNDEEFFEERDFYTRIKQETVFETSSLSEEIPPGYTSATIPLNAKMSDALHWEDAKMRARTLQEKGYKLLFDLNLGLFQHLEYPLDSKTQFATLGLAVQEFQKQILSEFQDATLGVIIARSSLLFHTEIPPSLSLELQFDEWLLERKSEKTEEMRALFWREVILDYIELLTEGMPDTISPLILFDCKGISCPLLFTRLAFLESSDRLKVALKNPLFPLDRPIWQEGKDAHGYIGATPEKYRQNQEETSIGVVLPKISHPEEEKLAFSHLREGLQQLIQAHKKFKIISEEFLTNEWEGLDTLVVTPFVFNRSKRKIAGFEAAGGNILLTCS